MLKTNNSIVKKLQPALFGLFLLPVTASADTIVNVQSNLGDFTLELFEDRAPAMVTQFLANVEAGNYQFSMVHQVTSVSIAGGSYFYNSCPEGPVPVTDIGSIPVEDTGLLNSNGTIAMVRNPGDPGTVGSEWHINLGKNENIYAPGAEPVVFGEVIEGLETVNIIADQWLVPLDIGPSVPSINYSLLTVECTVFNRDNVVKVAMQIESVDPIGVAAPANIFDESTSLMNIKVDAGAEGLLALSLQLQSTEPEVVFQAQPETVTILTETVDGIASFDAASGELTIPELSINDAVLYTNLVLLLTDPDNLFFTLQSFSTP